MRYGNANLGDHKTLKDWLLCQIEQAEATAPPGEPLVFILPLTGTRYALADRGSLPAFKKRVAKCTGLGWRATCRALDNRRPDVLAYPQH